MLFNLMCLYVSLYYIRPTEWVPGIIDAPLFLGVGIICMAAIFFSALSGRIKLIGGGSEAMMVGFIISIICSHLSRGYLGGVYASLMSFFPVMVGYFLITSSINSRKRLNSFMLLLISLSSFLAFEGWLQHATGLSHGGMDAYVEHKMNAEGTLVELQRIRWYGVFNDPNDLGLALVIVLPFLLEMLKNKRYLLPLLCLPLISVALYYTNSRGSILASLVSVMAYFTIRYRSMKGMAAGLILGSGLLVFGPSRMSQLSSSEASAHGRVEAWYQGYQMLKSHPLFGVGQGRFVDFHTITAHNSFVLVMSELGIVGTFFFAGIFYYSFNWLWKYFCQNNENKFSAADIGMLSSIYGSLFGLLTSMFFLSRAYVLIPFILLAMTSAGARVIDTDDGAIEVNSSVALKDLKNIAIITFMQLLFVNIVVKLCI